MNVLPIHALGDDSRRLLRRVSRSLTDAHEKVIDAELDPHSEEFDLRRAQEDRDEAEVEMTATMRRLILGPRVPGAWGERFRGHRAAIIEDAVYVLIERSPAIGVEKPAIIIIPVGAIVADCLTDDRREIALQDALEAGKGE